VNKQDKIKRLCKCIIQEGSKRYGDYLDKNWNGKAHVEITITVDEVRLAHSIYYNTKATPPTNKGL